MLKISLQKIIFLFTVPLSELQCSVLNQSMSIITTYLKGSGNEESECEGGVASLFPLPHYGWGGGGEGGGGTEL